MKAAERRRLVLKVLDEARCQWSTVAYLAREVRDRRSLVAMDLRYLSKRGEVELRKVNHVIDGSLEMGRQHALTILIARRTPDAPLAE